MITRLRVLTDAFVGRNHYKDLVQFFPPFRFCSELNRYELRLLKGGVTRSIQKGKQPRQTDRQKDRQTDRQTDRQQTKKDRQGDNRQKDKESVVQAKGKRQTD
ncbi:hypothetical protein V3C99_010705 [Haemonchus contortus]|uniref:Transposase n=1 Tax=Haemonchus contortus TaxID=6289 RepID=A0A7I4Y8H3_HAECO